MSLRQREEVQALLREGPGMKTGRGVGVEKIVRVQVAQVSPTDDRRP